VAVEKTAEASSVRSLDRGLLILDALIANPVQSLNQISGAVELPKSTTHRLLMTLQSRGYVNAVAGETGLYQVGVKGMWFTSARNRIHRQLESLQSKSGETVNFGVIVGREVEYIDRVISDHALRWGVDIGSRIQMYCSGMGKAILAFREDLLPVDAEFPKRTSRTISDKVELRAQLDVVRHHGFATDDEEFIDGVMCIAVPVRDESSEVVGALSVSGPAVRFTRDVAYAFAPTLLEATNVVSAALGYTETKVNEPNRIL